MCYFIENTLLFHSELYEINSLFIYQSRYLCRTRNT